MLRSLPEAVQAELVKAWNFSRIPPDAAYFADFVRTRIRRCGIVDFQHAKLRADRPTTCETKDRLRT